MKNPKSGSSIAKFRTTPKQAADELFAMNITVAQYENGVQANRKRCLETFKKADIKFLIDMQEELIAYGEEVIKNLKVKRFIKLLNAEINSSLKATTK